MAIDRVGWTMRPNPTRKEGERRKRPEPPPRKQRRNEDTNGPRGRIDELA